MLERRDYYFALERAAVQFEPDDPLYIRVASEVYDHIIETRSFDSLRATRHFGSMAFYYCINDKIDELLRHLIESRLKEAHLLVQLYYVIHPAKADAFKQVAADEWPAIKFYTKESAKQRHILELAIQAQEDLIRQQQHKGEQQATSA